MPARYASPIAATRVRAARHPRQNLTPSPDPRRLAAIMRPTALCLGLVLATSAAAATVTVGGVSLRVVALSPEVLRLTALSTAPEEPGPPVPELSVVKPEEAWPGVPVAVQPDGASVRAGSLSVSFAADGPGRVTARVRGGPALTFAPATHTLTAALSPGERVFGFGDKRAAIDQRGHTVEIVNRDAFASETNASYKSIPFCWTTRGCGLYLHDWRPSQVDVGAARADRLEWVSDGGALDVFVFLADRPRRLLSLYTELTGRPALLPRWVTGYHQGKAAYAGRDAFRVAGEMRRRGLPLEAIYYDDHVDEAARPEFVSALWRRYHVRLTMGGNPFPIGDPEFQDRMAAHHQLMEDGAHDPVIEPAEEIANDQGVADAVGYVDFFSPAAAQEFVSHEWASALGAGVALGMADFGELDHVRDAAHRRWPSLARSVAATRDLYALAYGRALVEGCQAIAGGRPTGMLRPGFAGAQRLGWTTTADSLPTFPNMRAHLRALLNLTLSGYSNVGYDIGGWDSHGPADVYARTFAAATFNPFMWAHGQKDHEPYTYGPAAENAARAWLAWRYRLLPFLYSLSEEAHRTGVPVQRPLALAVPEDAAGATVDDQFFVGEDLMVAPVFDSAGGRAVHLPPGPRWYDLFGGAPVVGGQTIVRRDVPWDRIPAFVRAGGILPLGPAMSWSGERAVDPLTVRYFARGTPGRSRTSLYEDDGVTTASERGAFARTELAFVESPGRVEFSARIASGDGRFSPPGRTAYRVELVGLTPRRVTLAGRAVPFHRGDGGVWFSVPVHPDPVVTIDLGD